MYSMQNYGVGTSPTGTTPLYQNGVWQNPGTNDAQKAWYNLRREENIRNTGYRMGSYDPRHSLQTQTADAFARGGQNFGQQWNPFTPPPGSAPKPTAQQPKPINFQLPTIQDSGPAEINTSITPNNIYTPEMTRAAVNQAAATQHQQGSLPYLLDQVARPGMSSRSPYMISRTLPAVAATDAAARQAQVDIPFSDAQANLQNMLAGQVAREQEAQGLYGVQLGQDHINRNTQLSNAGNLLGLLGQFI